MLSCGLMSKGHIFLLRFEAVLRQIRGIQIHRMLNLIRKQRHICRAVHISCSFPRPNAFNKSSPLPTSSTLPAKEQIEQMARVISKELLAKGICVNAVAPGPTGTDLFYKGKTEQMLKVIAGSSPTGRIGRPEEIAEAIVWLSGGQSGWVSGQVLRANGGVC